MKNKNLAIAIFVFSIAFFPMMAFGFGDPPPLLTPAPLQPEACPYFAAGCGKCHPNIRVESCGENCYRLVNLGSFQTCTDVSADFCSINVYKVSCGGGDGGGGNPPPACTPSPESCGVCKASVGLSGPSDVPFTQTCTDSCRTYEKACTPPPSCVPNNNAACTSEANICGMTSQGTINCIGECSATKPVDSLCRTCTSDCDRNSQVCAGTSYTVKDSCGNDVTCQGTRSCDYNWKEVAP